MGYGANLKDLGVIKNALAFTGKKTASPLNNLQTKQPLNLPQWLTKGIKDNGK